MNLHFIFKRLFIVINTIIFTVKFSFFSFNVPRETLNVYNLFFYLMISKKCYHLLKKVLIFLIIFSEINYFFI